MLPHLGKVDWQKIAAHASGAEKVPVPPGAMPIDSSSSKYFPRSLTRALNGSKWRPPSGTMIKDFAFGSSLVNPSNSSKTFWPSLHVCLVIPQDISISRGFAFNCLL